MQTTEGIKKKKGREKIVVLTSYDYWTTLIINEIGVDIVLVGDSLGTLMLGYKNSLPVTMDEMIHHTKAVVRGNQNALVVGDMPFMSDIDVRDVILNAGRFIKEGGAGAVKIEGGAKISKIVQAVVDNGVPVMGHVGLTPQDVLVMGGYKRQNDKNKILDDALSIEKAGAFCIVLECVSEEIAIDVTKNLKIPTIGIGCCSGVVSCCDGQVSVTHDLLGLCPELTPKFVHPYANIKSEIIKALNKWKNDISK